MKYEQEVVGGWVIRNVTLPMALCSPINHPILLLFLRSGSSFMEWLKLDSSNLFMQADLIKYSSLTVFHQQVHTKPCMRNSPQMGVVKVTWPIFGRPFVKRFALCYRSVVCLPVCLSVLSCPVCLSVTLVYCGQTVWRIKMKLDMQVGLVTGHIVFDGYPAALQQLDCIACTMHQCAVFWVSYFARLCRSSR